MTPEHDILLSGPLPQWVLRLLLFVAFELHLAFALLTLGVTIIAGVELLTGRSPVRSLRTFSTQKSLAVVIGVGALILMLVLEPVPMLRGLNRVAPGWLALVLLLVVALPSVELSSRLAASPRLRKVLFLLGGLFLLAVPAVFASMVVSVENPELWQASGAATPSWPGRLLAHYALRLAHVLGAAVVFSGGLLLLWRQPPKAYTTRLRRWIETALWFQILVGIALLGWLPHAPTPPVIIAILTAVAAAALFAKILTAQKEQSLVSSGRRRAAGLLLVLLTGMLLARQLLQDKVLVPLNRTLIAERHQYAALISEAQTHASRPQLSGMPVRSKPAVIYEESCMFCHGGVGNGQGHEAARLHIAPEDLTAVRSTDAYLYQVLRSGVPGTPMPTFSYYTKDELYPLIAFLHRLGVRERPEALPATTTPAAQKIAANIFSRICADCHGQDGRGNGPLAAGLAPKPPDFTNYSVSPNRGFQVISWGYRGTAMPAFFTFPEELRWALAGTVNGFYIRTIPNQLGVTH